MSGVPLLKEMSESHWPVESLPPNAPLLSAHHDGKETPDVTAKAKQKKIFFMKNGHQMKVSVTSH